MPELPEVETVVRDLRQQLLGKPIIAISRPAVPLHTDFTTTKRILRLPMPELSDFTEWRPAIVQRVMRRAKYIVCQVGSEHLILAHLGMTGSFYHNPQLSEHNFAKHCHLRLHFPDFHLEYRDPRRFGFVCLLPRLNLDFSQFFSENLVNTAIKAQILTYITESELAQRPASEAQAMRYLYNIGVEPFSSEFSSELLQELQQKAANPPIKSLLMNNALIAGIGNIYASELLFLAGISPLRRFKSLNFAELTKIVDSARHVLTKALEQRGSSIANYRDLAGNSGGFQNTFTVYGKNMQICSRCTVGVIEKVVIAGRASFWCPKCQV